MISKIVIGLLEFCCLLISLSAHYNCSSLLTHECHLECRDIATITIKNTNAFALWKPNCPPLIPLL